MTLHFTHRNDPILGAKTELLNLQCVDCLKMTGKRLLRGWLKFNSKVCGCIRSGQKTREVLAELQSPSSGIGWFLPGRAFEHNLEHSTILLKETWSEHDKSPPRGNVTRVGSEPVNNSDLSRERHVSTRQATIALALVSFCSTIPERNERLLEVYGLTSPLGRLTPLLEFL